MNFDDLMQRFAAAAVSGDGRPFAALFAEDGQYHDVFYGTFTGRTEIADMLENRFHRDATNFRWDMHDPVCQGDTGYVRYLFSYDSKLDGAEGRRGMFEGVAIVGLRDGLIISYREVANVGPCLSRLGFTPDRLAKLMAREAEHLAARPEASGHTG